MKRIAHWILQSIQSLDDLVHLPTSILRYIINYYRFRHVASRNLPIYIRPTLFDYYKPSGEVGHEYFYQDLFVSQLIYKLSLPDSALHLDIGSRIDGFVAQIATFRPVIYLDIRPSEVQNINISSAQGDITSLEYVNFLLDQYNQFSSISCLHVFEHFGLGRYGDPIGTDLYNLALRNIYKLLQPSGNFYLSTPVGFERVEFDCNYVFNPTTIINCAEAIGFKLEQFFILDDNNLFKLLKPKEFLPTSKYNYNLGLFVFSKV